MDLQYLLTWNRPVMDGPVLAAVAAILASLVFLFMFKPDAYLPLLVVTMPLPKLFTIGYRSAVSLGGYVDQSDPGFSLGDLVLVAGLLALAFRGHRRLRLPQARNLARAQLFWCLSIGVSVLVGVIAWRGLYHPTNVLYALRYGFSLSAFGAACKYMPEANQEAKVRRLMNTVLAAGALRLALGIAYYFTLGSAQVGGIVKGVTAYSNSDSLVFRNYLWFFDYGNDMGFYAATLGVLALTMAASARTPAISALSWTTIVLSIAAVLLIGERANLVVLATAAAYLLWENLRKRQTNRRRTARLALALLFVFVSAAAILSYIHPDITDKVSAGGGYAYGSEAEDFLASKGVPGVVTEFVSTLPFGDNTMRAALATASLWSFLQHPLGVGFWGELQVLGWFAHHEIAKVAVEQGLLGLAAYFLLMLRLKRLLWSSAALSPCTYQLGAVLRSASFGLFMALVLANTVVLDIKFATLYWTLLGIWAGAQQPAVKRNARIGLARLPAHGFPPPVYAARRAMLRTW